MQEDHDLAMQRSIEQKEAILKQIDMMATKRKVKMASSSAAATAAAAEKSFAQTVIRENQVIERYSSKRNSIIEGSTRPSKDFANMLLQDADDETSTSTEALLNTIINQMKKTLKIENDNLENKKGDEASIMNPDPNEEIFYLINDTFQEK
jgi:hypothetical protein